MPKIVTKRGTWLKFGATAATIAAAWAAVHFGTQADRQRLMGSPRQHPTWVNFDWYPWRGFSPKAAVMVPVQLNGRTCMLQLDTGVFHSCLYGAVGRELGLQEPRPGTRAATLKFGSVTYPNAFLDTRPGEAEKWPGGKTMAGTVGLDLIDGHLLVLDYPRHRFALGSDLPASLTDRFWWQPAFFKNGWLFTQIKINGHTRQDMFFDTGSSAIDLLVNQDDWQSLTGMTKASDATNELLLSDWNGPAHFIEASSKGDLEIGPVRVTQPTVFFERERPNSFKVVAGTAGVLGGKPFSSRVVALDLRAGPRIGILQ